MGREKNYVSDAVVAFGGTLKFTALWERLVSIIMLLTRNVREIAN